MFLRFIYCETVSGTFFLTHWRRLLRFLELLTFKQLLRLLETYHFLGGQLGMFHRVVRRRPLEIVLFRLTGQALCRVYRLTIQSGLVVKNRQCTTFTHGIRRLIQRVTLRRFCIPLNYSNLARLMTNKLGATTF